MNPVLENQTKVSPQNCQVLVIGDAMIDQQYRIDQMPKAGEDTMILQASRNVGGSGANSAIALAYLGVSTKFCGMIGHDLNGDLILEHMRAVGVDISGVGFGETTGFTLTMIDSSSERTMFSFRGASSTALSPDAELLESCNTSRIFLTSGYQLLHADQAEVALLAAEGFRAAGNLVAFDPSPLFGEISAEIQGRMLALTDILLPNRHELTLLTGEEDQELALRQARQLSPCVVVKLGSKGAWMSIQRGFQLADGQIAADDLVCEAPAKPTKAVDSTGAGDAFNAGFLAAYLRNEQPENWLKSGNSLACEVVQHQGAVSMFYSPSQKTTNEN